MSDEQAVPPTPNKPYPGYYRFLPPDDDLWLYYDGSTWIGDPVQLPWWKMPMEWAVGRTTRGQALVTLGLMGLMVGLYYLFGQPH